MSDHATTLPPAVARQVADADALYAQAYTPQTDPAEPPITPQSDGNQGDPQHNSEPPAVLEPQTDNWEHKYNSIKGRYDAEVPRLRDQVNTLVGELSGLRTVLAQMHTPDPAPTAPVPNPATIPAEYRLTPEEEESYGQDFVKVVDKKAREVAFQMTADLRSQVNDLTSRVNGVNHHIVQGAREEMLARMGRELPDWETQNRDEGFLGWLQNRDPYSGAVRGSLLSDAFERNDSGRVLAFFNGYRNETATIAPPAKPNNTQPPSSGAQPRVDLASLVAPGRQTGGAPTSGTPNADQFFTKAQISQYYKDLSLGRWDGREAEAAEIERSIHRAGQEGRIR